MYVCSQGMCTACGACRNICPRKCIIYKTDKLEMSSAYIQKEDCINCNLCKKVCPIENKPTSILSEECYAAWSVDKKNRNTSASGGIASEFYHYASEYGVWFAGVKMDKNFNAVYCLEKKNWKKFLNSKYVYSDMNNIYPHIKEKLCLGNKVVFVGLPCQVAGLKNYLAICRCSTEYLLTIDLICHGVTPPEYLKKHIQSIEKKYRKNATEILFRDPDTYTFTYTFTLKSKGVAFYRKKVSRNDVYQIAYHKGIGYRENCYRCQFANKYRVGDITLADFGGVGSIRKCIYDNKNVSCILVNTEMGKKWLNTLSNTGKIYIEKRPIEEEYQTEGRIHSPTQVPKERDRFITLYSQTQDFEKAMKHAAKKIILKNEACYILHIELLRQYGSRILPEVVKRIIKAIVR